MNTTNLSVSLIFYTLVTIAVIGCSAGTVVEQGPTGVPPVKWEVAAKDLVTKKPLNYYESIPITKIGQQKASEIVEKLQTLSGTKLSLDRVSEIDNRLVFSSEEDPSAVFDIDTKYGALLFNAGLKQYSGEGNTPGLPSEEMAPELAQQYLSKLDYFPKDKGELILQSVGGLGMAMVKDGKSSEKYQKLVTVVFRRNLDGIRVQGRGSRMIVHLGKKAAFAGLVRNWPEVKAHEVSQERLKNDKQIREEITSRLKDMAGKAEYIAVQKAELVLFDDGRGVIEPAIYVVAMARYEGPKRAKGIVDIPVDFYVPALTKHAAYYPFQQDADAKVPKIEEGPRKAEPFVKDETK